MSHQCQRQIVLYAFHKKVRYFSTECPYASAAQRGVARRYLTACKNKNITLRIQESVKDLARDHKAVEMHQCERCGAPLVGTQCQTCQIKAAANSDELKRAMKTKR
jgi:cytoplasmic tRNA 2-thiolation protein 1